MLGHQCQRFYLVGHSRACDPLHPGEWLSSPELGASETVGNSDQLAGVEDLESSLQVLSVSQAAALHWEP